LGVENYLCTKNLTTGLSDYLAIPARRKKDLKGMEDSHGVDKIIVLTRLSIFRR
jgi:hypothetical protein